MFVEMEKSIKHGVRRPVGGIWELYSEVDYKTDDTTESTKDTHRTYHTEQIRTHL